MPRIVVYEDEADVHLNPKIGLDWMVRGQQKLVVTPGNNMKAYLAGALDARDGTVRWVGAEKKNSALFVAMLDNLDAHYRTAKCIQSHHARGSLLRGRYVARCRVAVALEQAMSGLPLRVTAAVDGHGQKNGPVSDQCPRSWTGDFRRSTATRLSGSRQRQVLRRFGEGLCEPREESMFASSSLLCYRRRVEARNDDLG